jgi:hypothetical protein
MLASIKLLSRVAARVATGIKLARVGTGIKLGRVATGHPLLWPVIGSCLPPPHKPERMITYYTHLWL